MKEDDDGGSLPRNRSVPNSMRATSSSGAKAGPGRVPSSASPTTRRGRVVTRGPTPEVPGTLRATCSSSSTMKDAKFPGALDLAPGAMRVCPYNYCSLNGHTHSPPAVPLRSFLASRRRLIKTQQSMKHKGISAFRKRSGHQRPEDKKGGPVVCAAAADDEEEEEEGGCSSEKRRAEWASLHPELVQLIADCVLSTSGVDEYMAMRAVCPSWRSSVAKPSPHAAVADPRFRPRRWVMLEAGTRDEGPLFLNVTTGRFRRLRLPVLRDYIFGGVSDGLLVLGARERPHAARLLNPLTGDMLPFATPIPPEPWLLCAITGSEPTIIFSFPLHNGDYEEIPAYCCYQGGLAVYSADPTGELRVLKFHDAAYNGEGLFYLQTMVTCAGNAYMLTSKGTLYKIVWTGGHWYAERILEVYLGNNDFLVLVESAGKLLLVKEQSKTVGVSNVDVKRKVLEPIESIGSSALFRSPGKCMVVDADMLPSIKRNCIYSTFSTVVFSIGRIYAWCDLGDREKKFLTVSQVPVYCPGTESGIIHEGPLSLAQTLLNPYPEVDAQLDRIHQT